MNRPIALITGASSGIGAAFAAELSKDGYDLVLAARRHDRLTALAAELTEFGAHSEILPVDLSERSGLQLVIDRTKKGDIDLLVSNAGVSAYGPFAELDPSELDRAWTLNADATPALARAVLPSMLERGRGGIIAVASNLAFSAGVHTTPDAVGPTLPKRALYVGAKAGMVAFTRALAAELAGTGVNATVVCPGLVSSEWNGGASRLPNAMTPDDVARAARVSFSAGEAMCFPGLESIGLLDELEMTEAQIMRGNLGSDLASRYRA